MQSLLTIKNNIYSNADTDGLWYLSFRQLSSV